MIRKKILWASTLLFVIMTIVSEPVSARKKQIRTEDNRNELIRSMKWPSSDVEWICGYLDSLESAYHNKDLDFIRQTISQDVIKTDEYIRFNSECRDYISGLAQAFLTEEHVNVRFDNLSFAKAYSEKEGLYAVGMQVYSFSGSYSGSGWLTLAFDLRKEDSYRVILSLWSKERYDLHDPEWVIERMLSINSR